jgi:hypothetical protein
MKRSEERIASVRHLGSITVWLFIHAEPLRHVRFKRERGAAQCSSSGHGRVAPILHDDEAAAVAAVAAKPNKSHIIYMITGHQARRMGGAVAIPYPSIAVMTVMGFAKGSTHPTNSRCRQVAHQTKARDHVAGFLPSEEQCSRHRGQWTHLRWRASFRGPSTRVGGVGQRVARPVSVRVGEAAAVFSFARGVRTLS